MNLISFIWDLWCCISIVGIWPRFIEPNLLKLTDLKLSILSLNSFKGLKIVALSDLHFHKKSSRRYINKLKNKILNLKPDLIFVTGDFLCYSILEDKNGMKKFLNSLQAPLGSFAVLGNHDYASYISRNRDGNYDIKQDINSHFLVKSIKRIFSKKNKSPQVTERAKQVAPHPDLVALLAETPVRLLHNESVVIQFNNQSLNITGLGDYWAGKCLPEIAFKGYNPDFPGIILTHNPDTMRWLQHYPGDLILAGHTHGDQVRIPLLSHLISGIENKKLTRGLFSFANKTLYVSRGVGAHQNFRFLSPPEFLLVTLC